MTRPVLWDDFRPGAVMGSITLPFDAGMDERWQRIYGREDAHSTAEGAGIAIAMMMRGYLGVVTPRPPGNLHTRQRFTLHGIPALRESVRTEVTCLSKEMRRERRYLELGVRGTGTDGRDIYSGILTLIWAQ